MGNEHRHFVIIGGQRCGSTYLTNWLVGHPEVEFAQPIRPEPKYFLSGRDHAAYDNKYFARVRGVLGEKSTSYLDHSYSAANIHAALPSVEIIALVRDPVDRAVSNYSFSRDNAIESLSISEALSESSEQRPYDEERFSASPFHYLRRGYYAELLEPWMAVFGSARLCVLEFEQLIFGSDWVEELCARLGIHPIDGPSSGQINASSPVAVSTETRNRLGSLFAPHNHQLAEQFGIDISNWTGA